MAKVTGTAGAAAAVKGKRESRRVSVIRIDITRDIVFSFM
jgi:hypothetical protein